VISSGVRASNPRARKKTNAPDANLVFGMAKTPCLGLGPAKKKSAGSFAQGSYPEKAA